MMLVEEGTLGLGEPIDRLLPELASRKVLRHVDGRLDDTVAAERPITVADPLTFRMGHGMLIEPSFDPPFPIVQAANELQLAMGPPDPRTPHDPDQWMERFGTLPLMYQPGSGGSTTPARSCSASWPRAPLASHWRRSSGSASSSRWA